MATPARSRRAGGAAVDLGADLSALSALEGIAPMLLDEVQRPFNSPEWCFELKMDGYRLMAAADPAGVRLKSRNGADATKWFPEVANSLKALSPKRMVLDGEVCVLDDLGRSDFNRLHARARRRGPDPTEPVVYCVFDVLVVAGRPVMHQPLLVRKKFLSALRGLPNILVVDQVAEQGEELYEMALQLKLEGLVAKRIDSTYEPGVRSANWLKIKRPGAVPAKRFDRSSAS